MRFIYIILSFLFLFIGCSVNKEESSFSFKNPQTKYITSEQELTMFVTTDWHYLAESLTDNGVAFQQYLESGDGKQLQDMDEILDTFAYEVNETKPDLVIISGDLTNNGEKASHKAIAKRLAKLEDSGTNVFVIPGNHDIANPWARKFSGSDQVKIDSIKANDFSSIYQDFGYEEALSTDPKSLSYLAAPSENVWLLMLDTNHYTTNKNKGYPEINGSLSPETINWIKACFAYAKKKNAHIIPVMHHNLAKHNDALNEGYTLDNKEQVTEILNRYATSFVLSGHIHAQDIHQTGDIYDIVTSALSVYPQQYGVINYDASTQDFMYETKKLNVAAWAKKIGLQEHKFINFDSYSANYFGEFAYDLAYKGLKETPLSDEAKKELANMMIVMNQRFFSGTEYLNQSDLLLDRRFKDWKQIKETFLYRYMQSIQSDNNQDDNKLFIPSKNN
ncbi:UDP-2,3-diacylglucosamine hydrolase [Paraliobacillus sp. PM-2]|uniref:metallophosphoesterase n=1 Tax=Paraliobacillus sp. PM-2 TaxID=1462524 RepID=UPI00061CA4C3|nr:metallophosphoesterase [Paraliobacillus sp. PM-2]CQR46085.1 UDP-2,3-diacylglucosamine hydrolase [Paraliobacillus sp. PM-2]